MVLLLYSLVFGFLLWHYKRVGAYWASNTSSDSRTEKTTRVLFWFTALSSLLLSVGIVAQERWVRTWDHAGYYRGILYVAKEILSMPPVFWWRYLSHSINYEEYNALICFLAGPLVRLFGSDLPTYTFVLGILGLLPFAFLVSVFTRQTATQLGLSPWIGTVAGLIAFGMPAIYKPMLQGMADIVVLPFAALAIVGGIRLLDYYAAATPIRKLPRSLLLSLLGTLFILPILRRYFGIFTLAWVPAVGISLMVTTWSGKSAWTLFIQYALVLAGVTATVGLAWFWAFPPFFENLFLKQYADIYQAYRNPDFATDLSYLLGQFGPLSWVLTITGLVFLLFHKTLRSTGIFLGMLIVLCIVGVWRIQSFGNQHYYMPASCMVLLIAASILAPAYSLRKRGPIWRKIGLGGSMALVGLVGATCVIRAPFGVQTATLTQLIGPLASSLDLMPRIRSDYATLQTIASDITYLNPYGKDPVYVAGSGTDFNDDIFQNLSLPDKLEGIPGLLSPQNHVHVDRRDPFPKEFLTARWVLVPVPMQYHLQQADQQLASWVQHTVTDSAGLGRQYEFLKEYQMQNGYVTRLYKRVGVLPRAEVLASLEPIRKAYPDFPAMYDVPAQQPFEEANTTLGDGPYALAGFDSKTRTLDMHPGKTLSSVAEISVLNPGTLTITPNFMAACPDGSSVLLAIRLNGLLVDSAAFEAGQNGTKSFPVRARSALEVRVYPGAKADFCDQIMINLSAK